MEIELNGFLENENGNFVTRFAILPKKAFSMVDPLKIHPHHLKTEFF